MSRFLPKSIVCLREGYSARLLVGDLLAGITVGIIALPLAMAFGIASVPQGVVDAARQAGQELSPPATGLYTAVIAGFLISALGGSRVQIGGPTGAFIVIVYGVAAKHGYSGLVIATLMAGVIVAILGLARFGGMIKFIPYPVTTGFTAGIAVIIFSSQIKDFFGLRIDSVPAELVDKWRAYFEHGSTWNPWALAVGAGSLAILIGFRKLAPRIPGAIVAVLVASVVVAAFGLPVETIGSKFGSIPRTLPMPHLPEITLGAIRELVPAATTIALLAAIESLLSAVVADGMTGGRHKADCELVAQGVANIASAIFGGLPATGAIARTAANIKSGGRTPVAGMVHALTLLAIMALLAPLASRIPLATLAAVLMMVAWNMSEVDHFRHLLRAPRSDIAVLLSTFGLTVFIDLTVAVGVGMVLAAMLFMKRMAEVSEIGAITRELNGADEPGELRELRRTQERDVPAGVEVFKINGPFFFGVADRLKDVLDRVTTPPRVFILRLREVPTIDATGLHALEELHRKCRRQGTALLLTGVQPQVRQVFARAGFDREVGLEHLLANIDVALEKARELLAPGQSGTPSGTGTPASAAAVKAP